MIVKIMENVFDTVKDAVSEIVNGMESKPSRNAIDSVVYAVCIHIKSSIDMSTLDEESSMDIKDHIDGYDDLTNILIHSMLDADLITSNDQNLCGAYYALPTDKNFRALYKKYYSMCHNTARKITRSDELAADTTSLVFEKIYKLSQSNNFVFDYTKPHKSYINMIASNTAKQVLRKNKSLVLPDYIDDTEIISIMQSSKDFHEWYMGQSNPEVNIDMADAVIVLQDQSRFPMFMDNINGIGNKDIGDVYDTSPKAAKTAIHRVRKTLRTKYLAMSAYRDMMIGELSDDYTGKLENYHPDTGKPVWTASMVNGELHGSVIVRDGYEFILSITEYHMGFKHGKYMEFARTTMYDDYSKKRPHGRLGFYDVKVTEGEYCADKPSGKWVMYNEKGKKDRTLEYNPDGTPGLVIFWKNGVCIESRLLSVT